MVAVVEFGGLGLAGIVGAVFVTVPGVGGWVDRALCIAGAVMALFIAARGWVLAIVADRDGVVIRNFFRSRKIAWRDIERFELPPPFASFRRPGLRVVLASGRVRSVSAYVSGRTDGNIYARPVVEQLNSRLVSERDFQS